MALAALISACRAADDPREGAADVLRASLPLAGGTLIEHQARLAWAAGAAPIIILVERLPATLTAAIDRLRRDGLRVEIARGIADATDRIHPEEALLVIADGCVAHAAVVARVSGGAPPALLTVPDDNAHAAFERIDAGARWGGLLLIDGARLHHTAAKLGEWDLESTLLRRAVQEGAVRIAAYDESTAPVMIADRVMSVDGLDRALIDGASGAAEDWPSTLLFPPLVRHMALPLLRRGLLPGWIDAGAAALALLALPFALFGWCWTALALLLLSGPAAAIGGRLAGVRMEPPGKSRTVQAVRTGGAAGALLLLDADLAAAQGWGCWLIVAITVVAMLGLRRERMIFAAVAGVPLPIWLASVDGLIWLMLPVVALGSWLAGTTVLAIYAVGSVAFVQHRLWRAVAGGRV